MPRLFSYLMTHDTGFAPNPFYKTLTLATCKPGIRRTKKIGDWVAGFASETLVKSSKLKINSQGLIYVMRIGEILSFNEYFFAPDFQNKKPSPQINTLKNFQQDYGDNIYYCDDLGNQQQLPNGSHSLQEMNHDTGGENVLIADKFYYFGRNCLVPEGGWENMGVRIPLGYPTCYGYESDEVAINNICFFLHSKNYGKGIHGNPCLWEEKQIKPTYTKSCHK
ncbi:Nmad2 family putative nucleotide modification protein [Polaromonas glacialis]|uniref:Nmad2 family putative nucleotide modification protein n=1 Tax=Polaromonas glacialis TaxID=866564 RepID=UPI0012EB6E66|nr:hypothetical protein [Polaromonas glacialis]